MNVNVNYKKLPLFSCAKDNNEGLPAPARAAVQYRFGALPVMRLNALMNALSDV